MRSNLIAGLDIGTTKTCAVIGEIIGDPRRPGLIILGVGQARTGGLRGDMVTNIEEMTASVRASLKEAELMAGVAVDRVYAGIGGDHVRATSSMGVVAVSEEDVTADDIEPMLNMLKGSRGIRTVYPLPVKQRGQTTPFLSHYFSVQSEVPKNNAITSIP